MDNIKYLVDRINNSNLSDDDKKNLINALNGDKPDWKTFLPLFYEVLSLSKEILEQFDIDIGELIKEMLNK